MSSISYVRFVENEELQQTKAQKRLKSEPLSPMDFVESRWFTSSTIDSDDTSRDSGIGGDSVPSSPAHLFSPAVNRQLDFTGCLSPADTTANVQGDGEVVTRSSPCHFVHRRQPLSASPLSPCVNHGAAGTSRRRRVCRRTAGVSGSASPRVVDVPPTSSDVCRPAAEPSETVIMDDDDDDDSQLIGDFSRPCSLPVLHGKHADLNSISPDTLARVLCNEMRCVAREQVLIIDCRYPYEYDAGHIKGAINIYTKTSVRSLLLQNASPDGASKQRSTIVIFHCEFSSKRGPSLARFLRQCDRANHADSYPSLSYPEMYLLEGGYKAFYEQHGRLCSPRDYVPMMRQGCEQALRQYRAECKRDSRRLKQNGKRPASWVSDGSRPRPLTLRF